MDLVMPDISAYYDIRPGDEGRRILQLICPSLGDSRDRQSVILTYTADVGVSPEIITTPAAVTTPAIFHALALPIKLTTDTQAYNTYNSTYTNCQRSRFLEQ